MTGGSFSAFGVGSLMVSAWEEEEPSSLESSLELASELLVSYLNMANLLLIAIDGALVYFLRTWIDDKFRSGFLLNSNFWLSSPKWLRSLQKRSVYFLLMKLLVPIFLNPGEGSMSFSKVSGIVIALICSLLSLRKFF
jgi:hypothetical protein